VSFLEDPDETPEVRRLYDDDTDDVGYVMNLSRVWGHLPAEQEQLFGLVGASAKAAGLSFRDRGILVTAAAATLGDSYCALAWGNKLAGVAGTEVVEAVLTGADDELTPAEQALARWARQVVADPNATSASDLEELRTAGYDDRQIAAITLFIGLRVAFSTVNDALGARPDAQLAAGVPDVVRRAVTWGRPPAG